MGTQVGNATPIDDVAAANSDVRIEDNTGEAASLDETSWTEAGGHDY